MTILLDSNILLRWLHHESAHHPLAVSAMETLNARGDLPVLCPQVVIEFWSVATRPAAVNGLGLNPLEVNASVRQLETFLPILPDTPEIYEAWRRLVVDFEVSGKQVHDARLVAVMLAHGIESLLTFNVRDVARYPEIAAVDPRGIAGTP